MRRGTDQTAERGFTLLEVMVALVIAAFALTLLYDAVSGGVAGVEIANHYAEGMSRARSHLAALGTNVTSLAGEHEGDDGGGYRWRIRVEPIPGERDPDGYTVYDCIITEFWEDGVLARHVTLETRRLGNSKQRH